MADPPVEAYNFDSCRSLRHGKRNGNDGFYRGRETARRMAELLDIVGLKSEHALRFHTRCPVAQQRCRSERPPLVEQSPGRKVACHYPIAAGATT